MTPANALLSKVTVAHQAKLAYVYIRQSSLGQLTRHSRPCEVGRDGAGRKIEATSNLPLTEACRILQPQDVFDLAHGNPRCGHRFSSQVESKRHPNMGLPARSDGRQRPVSSRAGTVNRDSDYAPSVFTLDQNRCSPSARMGVHAQSE